MTAATEFFDQIYARYGNPEAFVSRVLETLEEYDMTQKDLAQRAGVSVTHLSAVLNDHHTPSMRIMVMLDEALDELVAEALAG